MPTLKNTRHESFAQARILGLTINAAYIEAGYKPNRSNAARMNANEHIQQRIQELQAATAERAEINAARVLEEICAVGLSEIRDLFNPDGTLRPVEALPEKVGKAIQSIKVSSKMAPDSETGEIVITTEIKFWDKNAALDNLFKHFGLYEQKVQDDPMAAFAQELMGKAKPQPVASDSAFDC